MTAMNVALSKEQQTELNATGVMRPIAALYVERGGSYYNLEGVQPWDQENDARMYMGPHPVVAHPPCQRWGKMWFGSTSYVARTGIKKRKGDDEGCFKCALFDVRRFGGVLEHPYGSHAWKQFGLVKPPRSGGWVKADNHGGFTCYVEQIQYGHYCPKPTYLYAVGVPDLPELKWGVTKVDERHFPKEAIAKHGLAKCKKMGPMAFKGGGTDSSARIGTPPEFRDLLIAMARSVSMVQSCHSDYNGG